ncbi:MAG TPA: hypothetical protein VH062_14665 [Polyangiaceae bacterium]|nr:hypothetical protein [Polyangiaceae bacterium]
MPATSPVEPASAAVVTPTSPSAAAVAPAPPSPAEGAKSTPEEAPPTPLETPIAIHGFASQGFIKTTKNDYLADSKRGSFEFTEVGINFTKDLTDRLRVGVQLFARNLGPIGNYTAQFDWFFLDYRFADWFGIRAGRTKLPFGLYNETSDVDAARVPVLLPQSVYPIQSRDYLLAQNGVEAYGFIPLGSPGDLEYRVYGGALFIDPRYEGLGQLLTKATTPYLVGGRLMWATPLQGLQLGGSAQLVRLDLEIVPPDAVLAPLRAAGQLPANFNGTVNASAPVLLTVGSIEYSANDLLIAAEYGRQRAKLTSNVQALAPNATTVSEHAYVMGSYRINEWFTPGVYYSALFPNVDHRSGRDKYQHDVAGTLRFDLNKYWLLKLEGHYMHGTAGLSSDLNGGAALNTLESDWGVFLVKTTVYF